MEYLIPSETTLGSEKGLAFDFSDANQNVDQSVNYNFEGTGEPGLNFFKQLPPNAIYFGLAIVAMGLFVMAKRKKK